MAPRPFSDELLTRCRAVGSPICLGFDPRPELLPACLRSTAGAGARGLARAYARLAEIVSDAGAGHAPIIKLQLAFFETLGSRGIAAYEYAVRAARERGLLVIADAKRGDIGTTAAAYADAFFGERPTRDGFAADAITLNAYLGTDSVEPFLRYVRDHGRGLFILVRTSNPSARELQDIDLANGRRVHDAVAALVVRWGEDSVGILDYSSVGMVVGATYPDDLKRLRSAHPRALFLVPGFGAQGGSAETVRGAFDRSGQGALIASSREIMSGGLSGGETRAGAVEGIRQVVLRMKSDLAAVSGARTPGADR